MRPLALAIAFTIFAATVATAGDDAGKIQPGGSTSPDGKAKVVIDLPVELRLHNAGGMGRGGPGTGSGLCVPTSIEHLARYQNERAVWGLQKWMTTREGGAYPEKVTRILNQYAPGTQYVQHTGGDEGFLKLALKTGRMVGVTYNGRDAFYQNQPIDHMVNLVYLDDQQAAILDNNREKSYVWMSRDEFLSRWRGTGGGWAVVLLHVPPPPLFAAPKQPRTS